MKYKISLIHEITAFLIVLAMFAPVWTLSANAQTMKKPDAKSLTEKQKIVHVLNRLGFGAREGDVEKVKAVGLNNYIEQQLNPFSIDDAAAEAKVKNLDVLRMSNAELFAKYPGGAAVLQIVAQKNGLKRQDLQEIRQTLQAGEMKDETKAGAEREMSDTERREYQRQIAEIYRTNNLGRPQQIVRQLNASRIMRAVYSERQLNETMVDFWTNHFNVYANKGAVRWYLPEYDRDVIRPNALGNFKDLLLATAQSPAMLFYLDNFQSVSPDMRNAERGNRQMNAQRRDRLKRQFGLTDAEIDARLKQNQSPQRQKRGINENYAREIMELHTLGVDNGYTQKDIQEVARAFTGWTIVDPRGYRSLPAEMENGEQKRRAARLARLTGLSEDAKSGTFFFNERAHDKGEKIVLGQKINEGGIKDGLKVIDILVNHPATARFIARKLAVKFVSDNPGEALVSRVADAFHNSKGDIKQTLRALFTDKEFFAPENYRAKIKTPFELMVSAIRAVGADTNGGQIQAMLAKMGEPLYGFQAPTGYPDTAEDWVNTGALLERLNFAVALASNRIPGTRVNLAKFEAKNKTQILDQTIAKVLGDEIGSDTKQMLIRQINTPLPEVNSVADGDEMKTDDGAMTAAKPRDRNGQQLRLLPPSGNAEVFKIVSLVLGTPDFQRQ